jgi:multidrug transporter EmrE-like cation transporter
MVKFLIVLLTVLTNISAQLSLRKGMMKIVLDEISVSKILIIAKSFYVIQGLILYVISFVLYLYVLSKFEVSHIYPAITGLGFLMLLVFSSILLGETITMYKVLGIILVSIGIVVMSL